ncbi:MAG TPA: DUF116 domain-containing protein [Pseudobacteroides sp.]|uniref:DUF116 domain-containing protein n=1 Tax=Pseudobacteroides sp. TaxID=1968840 RepID=UPI002F941FE3
MYTVTYSLRDDKNNSEDYYFDIALFTDEVLEKAKDSLGPYANEYLAYTGAISPSDNTSKEEYFFELLILGVLWNVYSGDALELEKGPQHILSTLVNLRQKGGFLKSGIDAVRGVLSTIFLSPDLYDNMFTLSPAIDHLEILLNWLEASGEFKYEVVRLRKWHKYLKIKPKEDAVSILAASIACAAWFEERSEEFLGKYTPNVDRYLNEIRPKRYWNEDVIFCGRRRVEYHLNMVGAEIMNRAFKKAFRLTDKKLAVVPACMCLLKERCQAKPCGNGLSCIECMKECSVRRLKTLGDKLGFQVLIIPHESSLYSSWQKDSTIKEGVGIIGIACVLNLVSGGLMLKEAGISAQCVLLDFCGCKKHWHQEGLPTEINEKYMEKIILG